LGIGRCHPTSYPVTGAGAAGTFRLGHRRYRNTAHSDAMRMVLTQSVAAE